MTPELPLLTVAVHRFVIVPHATFPPPIDSGHSGHAGDRGERGNPAQAWTGDPTPETGI